MCVLRQSYVESVKPEDSTFALGDLLEYNMLMSLEHKRV